MQGDWPTDIFKDQKARFKGALGPRFDTELKPLQESLSAQKHPWNIIRNTVLLGGGASAFGLHNVMPEALIPAIAATGIGFIGAQSVASKKNRRLRAANNQLDNFIQDAVGLNIYDVSRTHKTTLQTFSQAGFLGRFDRMHYLAGLAPKTSEPNSQAAPQSIGTKLTRRETETYTDSKGRRRTRTRIVKVFEGLMLEMDVEGFDDDNRILITSRNVHGFYGPFDRVVNGRRPKMDKVKTASTDFNKAYDVMTDDQTLAHLFLDPVRVMRLNNLYDDLRQILDRKRPRISILITRGRAWIALETDGLPNMQGFSGGEDALDKEIGHVIGQAALPHIIAKHLEWPNPMPYAWQDYIEEEAV